jgi:hypothetical protein
MVNTVKIHLFSEIVEPKTKCKFTSSCDLYSSASYTCTHTGGDYCGKYRKLSVGNGKFDGKIIEIPQ